MYNRVIKKTAADSRIWTSSTSFFLFWNGKQETKQKIALLVLAMNVAIQNCQNSAVMRVVLDVSRVDSSTWLIVLKHPCCDQNIAGLSSVIVHEHIVAAPLGRRVQQTKHKCQKRREGKMLRQQIIQTVFVRPVSFLCRSFQGVAYVSWLDATPHLQCCACLSQLPVSDTSSWTVPSRALPWCFVSFCFVFLKVSAGI